MKGHDLSDGVIALRPMSPSDADVHLAAEDEPAARFLSGGRSTIDTVLAWIERNRLSLERDGAVRSFGVCEVATGDLVGMVEANLAAPGFCPGVANVSYGVYPAARGRGYATRAVHLMFRYLEANSEARIAAIQVDSENIPSIRVPIRAGFLPLGRRPTSDGRRMLIFAKALRPPEPELSLTSVCEV